MTTSTLAAGNALYAAAPMSMVAVGAPLAGAIIGLGVTLLVITIVRATRPGAAVPNSRGAARPLQMHGRHRFVGEALSWRTWTLAIVAAIISWLWTGWPVMLVIAGGGVWLGRYALAAAATDRQRVDRINALAAWLLQLAGLVREVALDQAIQASARKAPGPIAAPLGRLADQLESGHDPDDAFNRCARDLQDPTADVVVTALRMAYDGHGTGLATLLEDLQDVASDDADQRRADHADRASIRSAAKIVLISQVGALLLTQLILPGFLAAYRTMTGQIVLLGVAVLYGLLVVWMVHLSRTPQAPRLIYPTRVRSGSQPQRAPDAIDHRQQLGWTT